MLLKGAGRKCQPGRGEEGREEEGKEGGKAPEEEEATSGEPSAPAVAASSPSRQSPPASVR